MALSIFARIGTIKGESHDARHKDEIDVLSWSWGVSQSGTVGHGGGGGTSKASFRDLTFTHHVDKASPLLMKACATGQHVRDATITVRKAGQGQLENPALAEILDMLVKNHPAARVAPGDIRRAVRAAIRQDMDFQLRVIAP